MVEVTTLDLVIIGLYLLFMLLVGVWFVKRIKNTDDYYVAGRTLGPVVLAATVCATIIGGSAMMGRAASPTPRASWPLPPPCPICWACLSSPATPGVFSRWGRSTTSSPSPACSSTASESRLNASWLLWWLSHGGHGGRPGHRHRYHY